MNIKALHYDHTVMRPLSDLNNSTRTACNLENMVIVYHGMMAIEKTNSTTTIFAALLFVAGY
jgi:hypothetical protein